MKLNPDWLFWPQTQELIAAFGSNAEQLRFVGGAVRDSLLNITVNDVDAATVLKPEQTIELLERAGIRAIPTGIKHGTITAVISGKHFEITTLRRDTSCDGRHAEVEFTNDWQEDAKRRDFTMNALYLSTSGELFDYFCGVEDAKAGNVRFIGNAGDRVKEDYLRILRFFRFYAYYGKAAPDAQALAACLQSAAHIATLSGERIGAEMTKLLAAPYPLPALIPMRGLLLEQVLGFKIQLGYVMNNAAGNIGLRLGLLLLSAQTSPLEALEILAARWKLSGDFKKHLLMLIGTISEITEKLPLARQKQLIRKLGKEAFLSVVTLKYTWVPKQAYANMLEFAESWQVPIMPVTGADMLKVGMPEGKELGEKLHKLEMLWEQSDYKLGKEELLSHL